MASTNTGEFQRPAPQDAPPPSHTDATTPRRSVDRGRGYSIAGGILGIAAIIVIPILLGPAGIALGYVGHRKGDPHGRTAMIVAGVGMVVGLILGFLVMQQMGFPGSSGGN
jgi:hypothetical protein